MKKYEPLNSKSKTPLILIVDDIPQNLQVLGGILNSHNYQIAFASSGKQALSVLETTKPYLILLDIMMPGMDGYEVCERIVNNPLTSDIPVIFLTGKVETDDLVKGFEIGGVDYITKPFNAAELLSRVKSQLNLKFAKDDVIRYVEELEQTKKELKELNDAKDKFFSIIAHDLKSPFSGFLGLSQLLEEEYEDISKEDIAQIAGSLSKAAKQLYKFLENLLDWSRAQMGRIEYNPINYPLLDIINKIVNLNNQNIIDKKINLNINIDDKINVYADVNMLSVVFRNLISNAIKFTPINGKINIDYKYIEPNFIEASIKDSGIGISNAAKEKLFRLDVKYSTPGTENEKGTGLGLLLSKELIEKNNGSIYFESEIGKGTTFFVKIPTHYRQ